MTEDNGVRAMILQLKSSLRLWSDTTECGCMKSIFEGVRLYILSFTITFASPLSGNTITTLPGMNFSPRPSLKSFLTQQKYNSLSQSL